MYLGRRAYSRGSDILEHRLALLTLHAFGGHIPTEEKVARLFQSTVSQGRSLIRSSLSKYRYQLEGATTASARSALEAASWVAEANAYRVEIDSTNLVELMNRRLATIDATQRTISRTRGSIATHDIAPGSYDPLCPSFGARPVPR